VGDAVLQELGAVGDEPESRVPALEVGLRVEPDGAPFRAPDPVADEDGCQALAAVRRIRDDASDAAA
jgi:hypothetical protein